MQIDALQEEQQALHQLEQICKTNSRDVGKLLHSPAVVASYFCFVMEFKDYSELSTQGKLGRF